MKIIDRIKKRFYNWLKKKHFPDYDGRVVEFAADWRDRLLSKRADYERAIRGGMFRNNKPRLHRLQGATNEIENIIEQLDISLKKEGL